MGLVGRLAPGQAGDSSGNDDNLDDVTWVFMQILEKVVCFTELTQSLQVGVGGRNVDPDQSCIQKCSRFV